MEVEGTINNYTKITEENIKISIAGFTPKLNNILNKIIVKEGYINCCIKNRIITTNGDSYLGVLFEVDVTGETADGSKEINIFFKDMPNVSRIDILSMPRAYENETFAYNELRKLFNDLQDEADIPMNEQFRMVRSYDETNRETIILENIKKKGYKTLQRMEVISIDVAEMAVKQLAKFHSLSFAVREKRPMYYDTTIKNIKTPLVFGDDWQKFLTVMCAMSINYLNDDLKEKFKEVFMSLTKKYSVYLQDTSTVCCLCHGDYRPSNIMVKEHNGEVFDIIPIDYQLLNFGCPINDFLYFIYTSTDKKFRKTHLEHLKNVYHETMGEFLRYFEINVKSVFPKQEFEELYKQRLDFGLINMLLFLPFMLIDNEHVPDITKDTWSSISLSANEEFKTKLLEAIEEFTEWGYLKTYE